MTLKVGTTSRGTGVRGNCGGLDNPTHYVRVKYFVNWIKVIPEAVFLVMLGMSSFPARRELSVVFPCISCPAGNELVLSMTKNTASDVNKLSFNK